MTTDLKRIEQYIKNATVKILADDAISGTGFFISADGFILTAYHCVAGAKTIHIETPFDGRLPAIFHPDKSLTADNYDLAVLQVTHRPSQYLPLGDAADSYISDNVVAIGYPAPRVYGNDRVGVYKGHLSRWRGDSYLELSDGIKGKGQSGGPVYHYQSQRVVGVVVERYKQEVMVDVGLATRLNALFEKWPTLHDLNRETCRRWDELLKVTPVGETKHPIVFSMIPEDDAYSPLQEALRELVENRWECQLLTAKDRQYRDNRLDNIRAHLEQANAFIAEVSTIDPQVMFLLGAIYFSFSQRLTILLTQSESELPLFLRGQSVVPYVSSSVTVEDIHQKLIKIERLKQLLDSQEREHFWGINKLRQVAKLPLPAETWQSLQARFPTREAWQQCDVAILEPLLGHDRDLAPVLLSRLQKGMV